MIVVNTPASDQLLTTLDRIKALTGITDATQDALLTELIDRASAAIATYCSRVFGAESVTETLPGSNGNSLVLSRYPVASVSEVRNDGTVVDSADYQIENDESGLLFHASGWTRATNKQPDYWAVDYVAGYDLPNHVATQTLPTDIEQACLETIKTWYFGRCRDMTIRSEQVGEYVDRTFSGQGLPLIAQQLLRPWQSSNVL